MRNGKASAKRIVSEAQEPYSTAVATTNEHQPTPTLTGQKRERLAVVAQLAAWGLDNKEIGKHVGLHPTNISHYRALPDWAEAFEAASVKVVDERRAAFHPLIPGAMSAYASVLASGSEREQVNVAKDVLDRYYDRPSPASGSATHVAVVVQFVDGSGPVRLAYDSEADVVDGSATELDTDGVPLGGRGALPAADQKEEETILP